MSERTALADLLRRTQSAHHEHQVNDLGGKRNEDWPQWYAQFLVDNGIADFVGRKPKQAELASLMKQSSETFEAAGSQGEWADFVAGELLDAEDPGSPKAPQQETPGTAQQQDNPGEGQEEIQNDGNPA